MPRLTGVALGMGSDGLLELVATTDAHGSSATVWHAREMLPENWSGWQPLGKPGHGDPGGLSVIRQPFGARLEAFVIDTGDQAVWHSWQFADPDEGWSDWDLLGNPGGHHAGGVVALTLLPDDRVMAVVAAGETVWHVSPPRPEPSSVWPAWSSLGRPGGAAALGAAAASLADGRVEVVALGKTHDPPVLPTAESGDLWYRWQITAGGGDWTGWERLGKPGGMSAGLPALIASSNGRLELFTLAGGLVWHRRQRRAGEPDSWTPWTPRNPPATEHVVQNFGVARDATGRLTLVGAEGNHLWYTAQTAPGASAWTQWSHLARVPGPPPPPDGPLGLVLGVNHAGRMELFVVITVTGKLYQLTETAPGQWPTIGQTWPQPS